MMTVTIQKKTVTVSQDGKTITVSSKGTQGLSAYDVAVKNGFKGTEEDWLASLGSSDTGGTGSGDMLKSVYDTDGSGIVDEAESAPWDGITGKPIEYPPSAHEHMQYSLVSDIQDILSSTDQSKPLSANQGRILKEFIDAINTVLSSDDTTLDEMQELVNYIKVNREILSTLSIGNIAGLTDVLAGKQDAGDYLLASAISAWAKAATKPTYDYSELTGTPSSGDVLTLLPKSYYPGRTYWNILHGYTTSARALTANYVYLVPIIFTEDVVIDAFTFEITAIPSVSALVQCAIYNLDPDNHNVTTKIAESPTVDVYAGGTGKYMVSIGSNIAIPKGVYGLVIGSNNNSVFARASLAVGLWELFGSDESFGSAWRINNYGLTLGSTPVSSFPDDMTAKTFSQSATTASPLIGVRVA